MKIIASIILFIVGMLTVPAQIDKAYEAFALPYELSESSGLIFFNDKLITHNDSGGNNQLYELNTTSQQVDRIVTISNITNADWEDITQDDTSIYIGDIGNNSGIRKDLKIYKISKADYLNSDTVTAETIAFEYAEQKDFSSTTNNTEWDAEALISFDTNNLILFSKNWVNGNSKAYLIPKTPGNYKLTALATTLNSGGLITGATYNSAAEKIILVGYTKFLQPFVWESKNFSGNDIFSGTNTQTFITSIFGFEQIEAITHTDANNYFITSESFTTSFYSLSISDYAKLIYFSEEKNLSLNDTNINTTYVYPNPVVDDLWVKNKDFKTVEIYDTKLALLFTGNSTPIDMQKFKPGIYFVKIYFNSGGSVTKRIIKK